MQNITGRYAPSPSGRMHLGNAFSAVIAWAMARKSDGRFLLRIEDLDPDRCRPEYAEQIKEDLGWLGLEWDEEGIPQSQRTEAYREAFDSLGKKGLLYPCFCSRADLHSANAPHNSDGETVYSGRCRNLSPEEIARKTKSPCWRICVPDREFTFTDGFQGSFSSVLSEDTGDFILRRADGVYAYQLAVVVDDAAMGVNQVVRGSDLLSSVPRQIYLYEELGYPAPEYWHVPLLCDTAGRRLSKRDSDLSFEYLRAHYHADEVLGLIAFLCGMTDRGARCSILEFLSMFGTEGLKRKTITIQNGLL